jgi:hypothetical protein
MQRVEPANWVDGTARGQGAARSLAWSLPVSSGTIASLLLVALYLGLVTWAQGFGHGKELLWSDRYFVAAIASGFGLQVGLFVYLRRLVSMRARRSAGAATAAGTGTSTAAMLACCAHHVTDALPVLGLSGAAILLNDYRLPLMGLGIGVNAIGVVLMVRLVIGEWRERSKEERCAAPA